jgi:hypothetical protein
MKDVPKTAFFVIAGILIAAAVVLPISSDWRGFLGLTGGSIAFFLAAGTWGLDDSNTDSMVFQLLLPIAFGCFIGALVYLVIAIAL